ncbi:MAG TPA: ABC transporter permease subunit [Mesorhizobium sp.]|jgi:octopine/nopaline transport system permease protein|uniref:ABC transporter permease n=1 Tax=Mesorhizobium sp. TaxID=1871066 RepID=UPI002DDCA03F|nr:ABC transporter permease subunit [Mesorhizobium sp.]HEV2506969.1 ABC transporter permease subunit [Mesorhizobium sp.]
MKTLDLLAFGPTGWGDELAYGAAMTLVIAVLGFAGGLVVGLPIAAARLSPNILLRTVSGIYVTVVRGVPELLVIYLLFFGGGQFYRHIADAMGYSGAVAADAFSAGVLAIVLICAAYSAEVFRGAFQAIPKGQIEAANAFGMRRSTLFLRIKLPQMLRYALPSIANVWQLVLKDTALISVTGLVELMRTIDVAAGSTRSPFLFYMVAIVIFLFFTSVSNKMFEGAERHFSRSIIGGYGK